jgi:MalT-like TPR region
MRCDMAQPFEDGEGEIRRWYLVCKALTNEAGDLGLMLERINTGNDAPRAMPEQEDRQPRILRFCDCDKRGDGVGVGLLGLADIARDQGNVVQMRMYATESLAIVRELQVHWAVGVVLNILALAAYLEGDLPRAFALSSESISMLRAQQAHGMLAEVLMTLSQIELAQGDAVAAYKTVSEALQLASAVGPRVAVATALEGMASLVVAPGHAKLATQLLAVASALRLQMGTPVRPVDQATVDQALATARSTLGDDAFAADWAEAQTLTLEQIVSTLPDIAAFAGLRDRSAG